MMAPSAGVDSHALAVFYLCSLAALTVWAIVFARQIDRRKYTLAAILALTGLLAVALGVGTWLLGR